MVKEQDPAAERASRDESTIPVIVSVILPCLNEAASVASCVERALKAIREANLNGEVIVCDNGSTDGSAELAQGAGAKVVHEPQRGYGSAYLRGFAASNGMYIVMGDADASYDFAEIPNLLARLQDGYDYVVGSRFSGKILPGAMPWTHRYIGNPVLTGVLNRLFGTKLSDAHSGLRAMTRAGYKRLALRCTGMELASEIAVRAAQTGLRSIEVPITYHPRAGSSKLRPLQDGWRHLRFLVGMLPGLMMILPGLLMFVLALGGLAVVGQPALLGISPSLSLHLTILFTLIVLVSGQVVILGTVTQIHSLSHTQESQSPLSRLIERALGSRLVHVLGPTLFVAGLTAEFVAFLTASRYPDLAASHLRFPVISLMTMMLGVQTSIAVSHLTRVQQSLDGCERVGFRLGSGESALQQERQSP